MEISVVFFSLIAGGVGAFFGAYLKKVGENAAMNEQFSTIRDQLKVTTKDTELIKQELSGRSWRTQQQWTVREKYYAAMLSELHRMRTALVNLSVYFDAPGSEHLPDDEQGPGFHRLMKTARSAFVEIENQVGPGALFFSAGAVNALNAFVIGHYSILEHPSVCSAEYVDQAMSLANETYQRVLHEAHVQLLLTEPDGGVVGY